jgi:hypothetical protein
MNKKLSAAELKKIADQGKRVSVGKAAGKTAKPVVKTTPGKAGPASKGGPSIASSIAKRAGTVAREARDVVTAVGSVGTAALDAAKNRKANALRGAVKDLPKQVAQVAKAAATGKSSNAALKVNTGKNSRFTDKATLTRLDRKKK